MSGRSEKVKAGIFVLVSAVLLVGSVVVIAGLRLLESSRTYYVVFSESVTGLEPSSTVRYNGVPVGRVADIDFAPDEFPKIRVEIRVEPDTPIRPGTEATLKPQGITGVYYVDLSGGSPGGDLLPEGSTITAGKSVPKRLEEVLGDFSAVVRDLKGILSENRESIGNTVQQIESAAKSFSDALDNLEGTLKGTTELATSLHASVSKTLASADDTLAAMRRLLEDPDTQAIPGKVTTLLDRATGVTDTLESQVRAADVKGTLDKIEELAARMVELEADVSSAVQSLRSGVDENRGSVLRMLADLQEMARNLKMASREIRREPSRLFFGRKEVDEKGREDVR